MNEEQPVLEIRDLRVTFPTESGDVQAVRGVDVTVGAGEMLGVVGESGSGKSVTFLAAMGLLPKNAKIEGSVKVHGQELVGMSNTHMRSQRGKRISMIFQDPLSALNPTHKIGHQVSEMIRSHNDVSKAAAWDRSIELLDIVGIPQPRTRASQYPHEFSGGMRQRISIAMSLLLKPEILIADEPTTALDVTMEAQILHLLRSLRSEINGAILFISHNLGAVAELCDRVVVLYAGEVVEQGNVADIFARPQHPYTKALLECDPARIEQATRTLPTIPGDVPNLLNVPAGCVFAPRCSVAIETCRTAPPPDVAAGVDHTARCHLLKPAGGGR